MIGPGEHSQLTVGEKPEELNGVFRANDVGVADHDEGRCSDTAEILMTPSAVGSGLRRHFLKAAVSGLTTKLRTVHATQGGGVILILFRELGAARLFAAPLHEIHGTMLALEDLAPRCAVERVQDMVASATSATMCVAVVERFLREQLRPMSPDPVVDAAVRAIHVRRGALRIAPLAHTLGISQDRLEKRFRRVVGASPKQVASIIRFRHTLAIHRPGVSLTHLAQDAGYCDQSHFNRDFRAFTGASPADFFRTATYCQSADGARPTCDPTPTVSGQRNH